MKRRSFIKITGITSIAIILPNIAISCSNSLANNLAIPDELLLIMPKKNILTIGKHYCKMFPDDAKKEILISFLSEKNNQKSIHELTTSDFISGRTVTIDGWILAKTEARQCALFSLNN